ncbi:MAG: DUF2182 domain-containing protein [Magnetovibrio sp.]|nr:DUF2182 domain-containing protein [Magnetovibrio sp.]
MTMMRTFAANFSLHTVRFRWLFFYTAIVAAWAALFAMQSSVELPEGAELLGLAYWASLCRVEAAGSSFFAVLGMWGLMSTAMMAPTAVPTFRTYDDLTNTDAADGLSFAALIAGYLTAWLGFSIIGAGLQVFLSDAGALDPNGRSVWVWLNAGLLAVAGLYQFSSLKDACLDKCRMPLMFFMNSWRAGRFGAAQMGLRLGVICIGCCWALMLLAFVGGVMSLAWMGVAMVLMGLEKMPALGRHLTRPVFTASEGHRHGCALSSLGTYCRQSCGVEPAVVYSAHRRYFSRAHRNCL